MAITDINSSVQKSNSNQQNKDVLEWLRPPDPWINHHKALDERHQSSGSWLLQHEDFLSWKASQSLCLWFNGISGCGKTVLSSRVIQALEIDGRGKAVLRFYFDFNDHGKQKLEDLLRSLANQLALLQEDCQKLLYELFFSCSNGRRQPSVNELYNTFLAMLKITDELWIVIDALDESNTRTGSRTESVLAWLKEILSNKDTIVHLFATSRPERDIESAMDNMAGSVQRISVEAKNNQQDIRSYVGSRLQEDPELQRWQAQEMRSEIKTSVLHEADGMFRLVACRLDMLRGCLNKYELLYQLRRLPETLSNVYERILQKIPEYRLPAVIRILQLLLFSSEPLTVTELSHAIAVEPDAENFVDTTKFLCDPDDIALYCPGLTVLVKRHMFKPVLQLSHLSVKEYLCSDKILPSVRECFEEQAAKLTLAEVCVSYLLHIQEDIPAGIIRQRFPFAQYCSEHWYLYGATPRAQPDRLHVKLMELLDQNRTCYMNCNSLYQMDKGLFKLRSPEGLASPLYYASFSGLLKEAELVLVRGANVNLQNGIYGSALQAASFAGYNKIVEMLLDHNADVNLLGGRFGSALQAATYPGHDKIVRILLDRNADVNLQSGIYGSALQAASVEGHDKIVEMLLDRGADANLQGGDLYGSALQAASIAGDDKIVKILLDRGADINLQGGCYDSPLEAAIVAGRENIVKLLLSHGANINLQGKDYDSALRAAFRNGRDTIVELLLRRGAIDVSKT